MCGQKKCAFLWCEDARGLGGCVGGIDGRGSPEGSIRGKGGEFLWSQKYATVASVENGEGKKCARGSLGGALGPAVLGHGDFPQRGRTSWIKNH